ncbi:MAG: hypothetical protein U0169_15710 [Polyangiaceae bacterium]
MATGSKSPQSANCGRASAVAPAATPRTSHVRRDRGAVSPPSVYDASQRSTSQVAKKAAQGCAYPGCRIA